MSTDLTPTFNKILLFHNSPPLLTHLPTYRLDAYLTEAHRINTHITSLTTYLQSIRTPYLSTTTSSRRTTHSSIPSLTDTDRDAIDAETKSLLRQLNSSIRNLADAEQIRQNTLQLKHQKKYGSSKLGGLIANWTAGGGDTSTSGKSREEVEDDAKANTIKLHRENVLWYLRKRLGEAAVLQAGMMEIRMSRVMERNKGVLAKAKVQPRLDFMDTSHAPSSGPTKTNTHDPSLYTDSPAEEEQFSPEQLQLFEAENKDLLRHYENTLAQVQVAEKSMMEIAELQTQLVNNLQTQSVHIEQLVQDSLSTTDNVGSGNKELKKATERKSTAKFVFYGSCALSFSLVLWDWLI